MTKPVTTNQIKFYETYMEKLQECVNKYPEQYSYDNTQVKVVADKMFAAFMKRSANKEGPAIKMTCKKLGIGYTYKAIEQYLGVK
jgi:predicted DNA-binding protein (MmcQ/YjbR family)